MTWELWLILRFPYPGWMNPACILGVNVPLWWKHRSDGQKEPIYYASFVKQAGYNPAGVCDVQDRENPSPSA